MAACDKLVEFVDKVAQRLSKGSLSVADANALTTFAQALHTEHECA